MKGGENMGNSVNLMGVLKSIENGKKEGIGTSKKVKNGKNSLFSDLISKMDNSLLEKEGGKDKLISLNLADIKKSNENEKKEDVKKDEVAFLSSLLEFFESIQKNLSKGTLKMDADSRKFLKKVISTLKNLLKTGKLSDEKRGKLLDDMRTFFDKNNFLMNDEKMEALLGKKEAHIIAQKGNAFLKRVAKLLNDKKNEVSGEKIIGKAKKEDMKVPDLPKNDDDKKSFFSFQKENETKQFFLFETTRENKFSNLSNLIDKKNIFSEGIKTFGKIVPNRDFREIKMLQDQFSLRNLTFKNEKELIMDVVPEKLGKLHIELSMSDNNLVTAKVKADNPYALHLFETNFSTLEDSLRSHGIRVDQFLFSLNDEGKEHQSQQWKKSKKGVVLLDNEDEIENEKFVIDEGVDLRL